MQDTRNLLRLTNKMLHSDRVLVRFHEIDDAHLGKTVLRGTLDVPLHDAYNTVTRPMDVEDRFIRACFTRQPRRPAFTLQADWVDPSWPLVVRLDWQDAEASPGYYYVRIEQIDGNIAWSSPIWFR